MVVGGVVGVVGVVEVVVVEAMQGEVVAGCSFCVVIRWERLEKAFTIRNGFMEASL